MRATYRTHGGVQDYWQARWGTMPADEGILNLSQYPGFHAQEVMSLVNGTVLEAGCGAGRVLRYFHNTGHEIIGIDFIPDVLHTIYEADASMHLAAADVVHLPFPDEVFAGVLAFGLYHNLEEDLLPALLETRRTLRADGLLCASFRADNIQNRLLDTVASRVMARNTRTSVSPEATQFHKMNYKKRDLENYFHRAGFKIKSFDPVENMSFLYKFTPFRAAEQKVFDESKARAEGYKLSRIGRMLQAFLTRMSPTEFCNVYVVLAQRQ